MRPVRAVVFDLDGTLIDSRGDIAASCNHALKTVGRPELTVDEVRALVGDGSRSLLSRAAGLAETHPDVDALLGHFLAYYNNHPIDHTSILPHVQTTLETLVASGFRLAICTNKPRVTTDVVVDALDLGRFFTVVIAGDDLPTRKPHPGQLEAIAAELCLLPAELVMVGDGPQDVLAGQAAGARTVAVRHGFLPFARLAATNPDIIVDDLSGLPHLVQTWAEATVSARPVSSADALKKG